MIGIITGDIINSTLIAPKYRQQLLSTIKDAATYCSRLSPLKYEIFRGDSFQFIIDKPELSLLISILIRAYLRKATPSESIKVWDARIAIGIGTASFLSGEVVTSDGEAFQLSGRGFDNLGKKNLGVNTRWNDVNEEFNISTDFADDIISNWTSSQAEVFVKSVGEGLSQTEIAAELDKTKQTVNKIFASSKINMIKKYIDRFQHIINIKMNNYHEH